MGGAAADFPTRGLRARRSTVHPGRDAHGDGGPLVHIAYTADPDPIARIHPGDADSIQPGDRARFYFSFSFTFTISSSISISHRASDRRAEPIAACRVDSHHDADPYPQSGS